MKLWGNEAFIGKSFVLPKTNLKTLFLTWVFTRNRELGSHMVLQRPPDILTSIGYTTSMKILCFTLVGVIIWKSQRKKNTPKNEHSCTHPARIHGNYTKRHFLPFECVARRCNILRSRNVGRARWKLATTQFWFSSNTLL